jgi:protein-tyrosine kinase
MSRIHEALKKAEQERTATQANSPGTPPLDPASGSLSRANGGTGATSADVVGRPSRVALASGNYLRFEDLRLHCAHPKWRLDPNLNVFSEADAGVRGAESFRTLRAHLYQIRGNIGRPLRTLMVTSAIPAEGKTFVANNLAQAIVRQPDCRVLLIDADLRCSRLHEALGAPTIPGLTDYLRGESDPVALIQHGGEGDLCFVPGGSEVANPSELLLNGRLKILLDRVAPAFDWVIFDSPPCLPVKDASILADVCDGVLMVVRAASTPLETAQRACQEFRERNLIGVVLNHAEEPVGYGAYDHYYRSENEKNVR